MKRALLLALLVANLLHSSIASAQEARTEWAPLAKSLTVLLNEGWRIISHGHSRGDQTSELFSFVLAKENKQGCDLSDLFPTAQQHVLSLSCS